MGALVILWDSEKDPPENSGIICRWNGLAETSSIRSLLRYAEENGERLRQKYLRWINDLGETLIDGRRVVERLTLEDGFSYWWMTRFVEKSHYKSPITDAIRLLAFEEIVVQKRATAIRLVSADRRLHGTVRALCRRSGIDYQWNRESGRRGRPLNVKDVYRTLPETVRALIFVARYLASRRLLRRPERSGWFGGNRSLFFCSYFFNLDPRLAEKGHHHSRYWEGLHGLIREMGFRANWLQLYVPHDTVSDPTTANNWIEDFNTDTQREGFHTFVEAYLSSRVVLRVFKRWLWLKVSAFRLRAIKGAFYPEESRLWLWPLMKGDWKASFHGPAAVNNLLWIELFDAALKDPPRQRLGLYLCENQEWERAFIHAWKKHGHGRLVAVPHSTVRFWDLRYFSDPRTIRSVAAPAIPRPDLVALNGKAALDAYKRMDYPNEAMIECEALRYGHLANIRVKRRSAEKQDEVIKVLILGDYLPSATVKLLQLLQVAASQVQSRISYTMKAHPNYPVKAADYPSLGFEVATESLGEVLHHFDVAYASNLTSAAVDAYLAGLPVAVMLDQTQLNFSPLRGQPGVRFVSTAEELAQALQTSDEWRVDDVVDRAYFFVDSKLRRWERLLAATLEGGRESASIYTFNRATTV